jgi:tetratricopeptide (TPR) repeat protein
MPHHALLGVVLLLLGSSIMFAEIPVSVSDVAAPDYRLPDDANELLRIDNEMKTFFDARIQRKASLETKLDEIAAAILGESGLHFGYESDGVYDVREAFRRRRGNCLTYSMLVVAVAREFGIPAEFNEVLIHPRWSRAGGLVLVNRHINVYVQAVGGSYELDLKFNEDLRVSRGSSQVVADARAFAGAYNNVGVYRLAAGDREEALRLMEKATAIDPTYGIAWTNLGGALILSGQLDRARVCFERALTEEPKAPAAISGLASVNRKAGRIAEAEKLERIAVSYRERNPYYLLRVARGEVSNGNLDAARRHLKRAIQIKDDEPEFYELMAEVARGQGLESEARRWTERSKRGAS